jgi:ribosome biogenesis GTPase
MQGIVMKSTGSWYKVRTDKGNVFDCRIKGKFRIKGIKSTNPVAVGDVVDFDLEPNTDKGIIKSIHNRKNYIVRKSVNLSKQTHIIAANIDIAFLVVTLVNPKTHTAFIDRFLASAEAYRIPVILLFNKIDLYNVALLKEKDALVALYESIGYTCIEMSATEMINIKRVKALMQHKTTLFSGHSGVGKSTLVNALESGLNIKTNPISESHNQGAHTTTFAEMHALSFGGYIIDTPGIKGFGVVDFSKEEVSDYFPEIFALKSECKFHNCLHLNEPKCAVIQAVEEGYVAVSRYTNYLQMIEEDEGPYR